MAEQSRRGYLVLADISGYTSFLASVELEHAHEILTDLLEVIVDKFKSLLTISKLEGDAVFAYVDEVKIARGEILLELIEGTYASFRHRRDTSNRATTCSCKACQSMPSLELKFFVHCGTYIVQHVAGIRELVGSDVNLAHRLMKNHITEHTGWAAYSMFTKDALTGMKLELEDVHEQTETYEHLGDIETITVNLLPRFEALAASKQYYFSDTDVDITVTYKYNISDVELWQILTSAEIMTAMMENVKWSSVLLPGGRTGVGAQNHCLHGKGVMRLTIVDWHPFTYFTCHGIDGKQKFYQMFEIIVLPDNSSTLLYWRWKSDMGMPHWINKIVGATMGRFLGIQFCKMVEKYIANVEKPIFQPEAE